MRLYYFVPSGAILPQDSGARTLGTEAQREEGLREPGGSVSGRVSVAEGESDGILSLHQSLAINEG